MELIEIDVQAYHSLQRRLQQLRSYRGTPDEQPNDDVRIEQAKDRLTSFLSGAIEFHGVEAWAAATRPPMAPPQEGES